jgi:hypothetical protein
MDCKGDSMIAGMQAAKMPVLLVSGLLAIVSVNVLAAQSATQTSKDAELNKAQQAESYRRPSLNIEASGSQNEQSAEPISRDRGYGLYWMSDGAVQARNRAAFTGQPVAIAQRSGHAHGQVVFQEDTAVATIRLTGRENATATSADEDQLPDAAHPSASFILFRNEGQRPPRSDFALASYADPRQIRPQFPEVTKLMIDGDGNLSIPADYGDFVFVKATSNKEYDSRRDRLTGHFALGKRHRIDLSLSGDAPPQPLGNDSAPTD